MRCVLQASNNWAQMRSCAGDKGRFVWEGMAKARCGLLFIVGRPRSKTGLSGVPLGKLKVDAHKYKAGFHDRCCHMRKLYMDAIHVGRQEQEM